MYWVLGILFGVCGAIVGDRFSVAARVVCERLRGRPSFFQLLRPVVWAIVYAVLVSATAFSLMNAVSCLYFCGY